MPSPQLQVVIDMLRQSPPLAGADVQQMRADMQAATAAFEPPADVRFTPVDAGGVPAEWTAAPGARDDGAIVYLHGGGYVIGSIATHRGLVARLSRATGLRVLSVDYRLGPEHPHPAAVEDAVAAFRFALGQVDPGRLAVAGDSAGGGLTLATLLALRDAGGPLPAAGLCISPWTDLTLSGESMETRAALDPMVQRDGLSVMAEAYLAGGDPKAPLASPLFGDPRGLPPLLIQVGSSESLLDDAIRMGDRARAAGVEVELRIWEDMIHVWHAFADLLPEGQQAIEEMADFLSKRIA